MLLYRAMIEHNLPVEICRYIMSIVIADQKTNRARFLEDKVAPMVAPIQIIVMHQAYVRRYVDEYVGNSRSLRSMEMELEIMHHEKELWDKKGTPRSERRHITEYTSRFSHVQQPDGSYGGGSQLMIDQVNNYHTWQDGIFARNQMRKERGLPPLYISRDSSSDDDMDLDSDIEFADYIGCNPS